MGLYTPCVDVEEPEDQPVVEEEDWLGYFGTTGGG